MGAYRGQGRFSSLEAVFVQALWTLRSSAGRSGSINNESLGADVCHDNCSSIGHYQEQPTETTDQHQKLA
jgi:hypothetical protein